LGRLFRLEKMAEGMGLPSNLLHRNIALIHCFHFESKRADAATGDAFNENRWLHWHVFGFNLGTVAHGNVGHWPSRHIDIALTPDNSSIWTP